MQREIAGIKARLDGIESTNRRMVAALSQIVGDLADVKREVTTKADLAALESRMNQRFDGFASLHEEMAFSRAVHPPVQ